MNKLFLVLSSNSNTDSGSSSSSTEKLTESLKNIVKSPIFYVVIGAIILLIIAIYLLRRIIRPAPNQIKVITRGGKIYKLIDEKSSNHFMIPFKEGLGAVISLNEKEFNSDKLFINNGPDALYKINYNLTYRVIDVEKFYQYRDNFQNIIVSKLNDSLREYADNGHVNEIIKDYRAHQQDLVNLINSITEEYGVEATSFKVNFIEPMGRK